MGNTSIFLAWIFAWLATIRCMLIGQLMRSLPVSRLLVDSEFNSDSDTKHTHTHTPTGHSFCVWSAFFYWLKMCKHFRSNFVFKTTFVWTAHECKSRQWNERVGGGLSLAFKFVSCMDITYSINCNDVDVADDDEYWEWTESERERENCLSITLIFGWPISQLAKMSAVLPASTCLGTNSISSFVISFRPLPLNNVSAKLRYEAGHKSVTWLQHWLRQDHSIHTHTHTHSITEVQPQAPHNAARVLTFMSNADFSQANNNDNKNSKTSTHTVNCYYICVSVCVCECVSVCSRIYAQNCSTEYVGIVKQATVRLSHNVNVSCCYQKLL